MAIFKINNGLVNLTTFFSHYSLYVDNFIIAIIYTCIKCNSICQEFEIKAKLFYLLKYRQWRVNINTIFSTGEIFVTDISAKYLTLSIFIISNDFISLESYKYIKLLRNIHFAPTNRNHKYSKKYILTNLGFR